MFVSMNERMEKRSKGQNGAALITTLLVATLLFMIGGALIVTTNMASGLAIDSTAEMQAYYAAEAGVNAALNVMRGNVASSPAGTAATFRNAVNNPTLATWLTYDTTIQTKAAVTLNASPLMGYSISLTDPDNTPVLKQPQRLLVHVVGYGPNGAKRQMEVMISRFNFDFSPNAAILVRGNDDDSTKLANFQIGNSNAKTYSGYDHANPSLSIPTFGTTHANDYTAVSDEIASAKPNTVSGVEKVKQFSVSSLPSFLQTADNARSFLAGLKASAIGNSRYFTSTPGDFGTSSNPKFTFVDGDCSLSDGTGLLVVTGTLTASGNVGFNGIIMVLGDGVFQRNGSGNGDTYGAIVVAKFAKTWPSSENAQAHPFLSATYDMNGGGNSTTGYDSDQVDRALGSVGIRNMGVREY